MNEVDEFTVDDMDVSTEVLIDHRVADGIAMEDGYIVDREGCVVRNNLAKSMDNMDQSEENIATTAAPVLLGWGLQVKKKWTKYGGDEMWDM